MELMEKELTEKIIGVCFEVQNELGSGFLEAVYQKALLIALRDAGIEAQAEAPIKVKFRGEEVGDYYADILVEGRVVLELKAIFKGIGLRARGPAPELPEGDRHPRRPPRQLREVQTRMEAKSTMNHGCIMNPG